MTRTLRTFSQDIQAILWDGRHFGIDIAPIWLRNAMHKGKEEGGAYQSFSDIWIYARNGVAIGNPGDYIVWFQDFDEIIPMKPRAFFAMMGGPVHDL